MPNLFAFQSDRRTGGRHFLATAFQANEQAVDVAQSVDAGDGFLTQITAFGEANRLGVAADLLRQVVVGDVAAKERKSSFNASRFYGVRSAGRSAGGLQSSHQ